MECRYFVEIGEQRCLEINAEVGMNRETLIQWLKEAVDSLSGNTRECGNCGGTSYRFEDFACQSCGEITALRLVKK